VNFQQFLDAAHILTLNCDEMAGNRPRRLAQAGIKDSYPLKSGYFTAVI